MSLLVRLSVCLSQVGVVSKRLNIDLKNNAARWPGDSSFDNLYSLYNGNKGTIKKQTNERKSLTKL